MGASVGGSGCNVDYAGFRRLARAPGVAAFARGAGLMQYAEFERISLKGHPELNEKWVQERIAERGPVRDDPDYDFPIGVCG